MLVVGVIIGSLITYFIMKKYQSSSQQWQIQARKTSGGQLYEEVSRSKPSTEELEMAENVAYGPIRVR